MESFETAVAEKTAFERLKDVCAGVGLDIEKVRPSILERMRLLAETTETVNDCERAADLAKEVFAYYEIAKPAERFSEIERKTVVVGSIFSDIGKTGPAEADSVGQKLIARMFAVENVSNPAMPVKDFFAKYFPGEPEKILDFAALGLDPDMSMREFWNLHSLWTLRIIQGDGVPMEAVGAAAAHHILDNVNPDAIVADDGRFTQYFGENTMFDRPEKLVTLLDQYDAARRRGRKTHAQAIEYLREKVGRHPKFVADPEFKELIDDLDTVMRVREKPPVPVGV